METVTLSKKFQVVIPKKVRERLNLKSGQKLVALEKGNSVEFVKISNIKNAQGMLPKLTQKSLRDHSECFN